MTERAMTDTYPPRGLSREEAARYIGVGVSMFDELVRGGRMPRPARLGRRVVWDRFKIDAAFADLHDDSAAENQLDRALRLVSPER